MYRQRHQRCLKVDGIIIPTSGDLKKDLTRVLWGRVPLGTSRCLNTEDIDALARDWEDKGGELTIRSPLRCGKRETGHICSLCYGADLAMKPYDKPVPVDEGFAAGLTAAQAIGERGTQLAMKRFHEVAGKTSAEGKKEERNAIKELRSLFVYGSGEDEKKLLKTLFRRVLAKEIIEDDNRVHEADGELPQALIHFETALMPLAVNGVGLGEIARESGGRFLSALANERIRELLSGDGPFSDGMATIKSRLIWEGEE